MRTLSNRLAAEANMYINSAKRTNRYRNAAQLNGAPPSGIMSITGLKANKNGIAKITTPIRVAWTEVLIAPPPEIDAAANAAIATGGVIAEATPK